MTDPRGNSGEEFGGMKANIQHLVTGFSELKVEIRDAFKENKKAHLRMHEKTEELQDDLTTSEIDMNNALRKVTDTLMIKCEETEGKVGDLDKDVGNLQRDQVWLGHIWKPICVIVTGIVLYIIKQALT